MAAGTSGLTTRGGCLLAAAAATTICSAVLDERDLLRVAVFVAALPLLALALTANTRASTRARRELRPGRVPVGTPVRVHLELSSGGRLPGAELLVSDSVPPVLGGSPRFVVGAGAYRGPTTLSYRLTPALRGVHPIGPLVVRISDPFGLARFDHELVGGSRLLVVPQMVPLRGLPAGTARGDGTRGGSRLRSGRGEDDAVVRPYRDGDDLRRVHWRSTARRDELMVRSEERPWRGGITVLLDRRAMAHRGRGPGSSLEWAVSLVASVGLHLMAHGRWLRLIDESGGSLAGAGLPADGVLDALAAVTPSAGHEVRVRDFTDDAGELLAVLGATDGVGLSDLLRGRPPGSRSHAVLVDVAGWATDGTDVRATAAELAETARALTTAGWTVAVGSPATPIAAVWDELCGARADLRGPAW